MKAKYLILMSVEMSKISIILIILAVIISLSSSCYSVKQESADTLDARRDLKILGVLTTSGEKIEFPQKNPGIIHGDAIEGITFMKEKVEINRTNIEEIKQDVNGKILRILTKDGKSYSGVNASWENDKVIVYVEEISIPLSEVESVSYGRGIKGNTAVFIIFLVVVFGFFRLVSTFSGFGVQ